MTRQAPPRPLSWPAVRGRSIVCYIGDLVVARPGTAGDSASLRPIALQPGVLLLDGHGHLDGRHLAGAGDAPAVGGDPRVLVEVARLGAPLVEIRAQAGEMLGDVLVAAVV